jgi:hypothetical protein
MSLDAIPGCIDQVATRYAAVPGPGEIERARQEFDGLRGKIYDDDELYPIHMAAFLEWFVIERPLSGGEPPVVRALREGAGGLDRELLRALAASHRSLFEVLAPGPMQVADLVYGGRWRVAREQPMDAVQAGDAFEGRLIPWRGRVVFGPVFCFHPRQARPHIHQLVRQAEAEGRLGPSLVFSLAEMRLRYSRFRNIAVERIYTWSTRGAGR